MMNPASLIILRTLYTHWGRTCAAIVLVNQPVPGISHTSRALKGMITNVYLALNWRLYPEFCKGIIVNLSKG